MFRLSLANEFAYGTVAAVAAFNNEISSADKIGLHLSEIGRLQNNAGSLLQFSAILFAICVYYFNALVFPQTSHRMIFAGMLVATGFFLGMSNFLFLRCLTLSVGWSKHEARYAARFLSTLSEAEIEATLFKTVRSFRRGTYFFFFAFFSAIVLVCLVAAGSIFLTAK